MHISKLSRNYIFIKIYTRGEIMVKLCLDKKLESLGITRYNLAQKTGIQFQVVDNYYKNKVKRYDSDVLDRICEALDCDIGEIIEYIKEAP